MRVNPLIILAVDDDLRILLYVLSDATLRMLRPRLNILLLINDYLFGSVDCLGVAILLDLAYGVYVFIADL